MLTTIMPKVEFSRFLYTHKIDQSEATAGDQSEATAGDQSEAAASDQSEAAIVEYS